MCDTEYNQMNGVNKENSGYASEYYSAIVGNPWVQQALSTYDWTKHSCTLFENTFEKVENTVAGAAQVATEKATNTYNTLYVRPKEAVAGAYNTSKENTKWAVETSKNAAVHTGTIGIGAAVLVTQLGASLSAGGAGMLLDTIGAAQGAGRRMAASATQLEQAVEQKIWAAVYEAQRVALIPVDKMTEYTHSFLDIVRVLVERSMSVSIEENPEATLKQRVANMAGVVVSSLNSKAHKQVIDPVHAQTKALLENLSDSFILVDLAREKREWAMEKVEEMSTSVKNLKARLESEAAQLRTRPEEILINSIRSTSERLKGQLQSLKDKGTQVFGDGTRMEGAISYLQELEGHLGAADDIYEVRDEVVSEARQLFVAGTSWTAALLNRQQ